MSGKSYCAASAAWNRAPGRPHPGVDGNASLRCGYLVSRQSLLPHSSGVCISGHVRCCACAVHLSGKGSSRPAQTPFPGVRRGSAGCNGCCSSAALLTGPATSTRRMSEVQLPPLRALDDFVLGSARLAAPDPCDPQRWCHRVINNLLYYQTNYLVCFGFGLALAGYVRPLHTLLSALVVAVALGVLVWAAENRAAVRRCRRSHPAACLAAVLAVGLLVLWAAGGACTFLFSIAGPVLLILVHASLRLRNLKNKIENKIESIGLKRTPMGLLLEALGQEQEAGS